VERTKETSSQAKTKGGKVLGRKNQLRVDEKKKGEDERSARDERKKRGGREKNQKRRKKRGQVCEETV
jgi:hypothetical protein